MIYIKSTKTLQQITYCRTAQLKFIIEFRGGNKKRPSGNMFRDGLLFNINYQTIASLLSPTSNSVPPIVHLQ